MCLLSRSLHATRYISHRCSVRFLYSTNQVNTILYRESVGLSVHLFSLYDQFQVRNLDVTFPCIAATDAFHGFHGQQIIAKLTSFTPQRVRQRDAQSDGCHQSATRCTHGTALTRSGSKGHRVRYLLGLLRSTWADDRTGRLAGCSNAPHTVDIHNRCNLWRWNLHILDELKSDFVIDNFVTKINSRTDWWISLESCDAVGFHRARQNECHVTLEWTVNDHGGKKLKITLKWP